jgi:dTMP kinase
MGRGKLIVFEGVGGSGKTTQIELAREFLQEKGLKVLTTREPGGVEASEKIRELIFALRERNLIDPGEQMVLFFAARYLWLKYQVKPALAKGINVLTDRAHTSTAAYQGFAEGGDLDQILKVSEVVMEGVKPDAVIFLDVSPETSIKRRATETNGDPFDKQGEDYLRRLIAGYRKMAQESWGDLKWYMVNGEGTIEEVQARVSEVLSQIFELG